MKACGRILLVTLLVLLDQQLHCAGFNYEDIIFEDLYKRLADLEDRGYLNDAPPPDSEQGDYGVMPGWDDGMVDPRDAGMADLRDQEYLEHEGVDGFQRISGGAGEGQQHLTPEGTQNNTQEVKSDESLPFYCHPPNPCPKGKSADEGCMENIKDTAEFQKKWINDLMKTKKCRCDEEHMFSCPKAMASTSPEKGQGTRAKLDDVLEILMDDAAQNPFVNGDKHESVVVKKSPRMFAHSSDVNPYLSGEKIRTVAKKG